MTAHVDPDAPGGREHQRLSSGMRIGPYEVRGLLGRGGMGAVYRAHDPRLGRDVAIKISLENFSDRFERESRAVAALNHPNICTIHDVGPNYLVMELLEGQTLADRIAEGPVATEEALAIARQIIDALEAAHDAGIVHRDLKPGNIALKPDGTVKVLDFGLAQMRPAATTVSADSPTFTDATLPGVLVGTAAYMSPEQARGKSVDKRTDIWAFGVILYEMLTGRRPFVADDIPTTLAAVLTSAPDLTRLPTHVRPLIERCLEKDPQRRLRDITGANLMLELGTRTERPQRRFASWAAVAVAAAGVSLAAIGWKYLSRADDPVALATRFIVTPTDAITAMGPLQVSPDGRWMVFYATDVKGVTSWWLRATDRTEMRPLPGTEIANRTPPPAIWSPDSRSIAFSTPGFTEAGQLKRFDIDTGKIRKISDIPRPIPGGSWSRRGVILLGGLVGGVTRVAEDGGAPTAVTRIDAGRREEWHLAPQFLSDERHFLYQRVGAPQNTGIYVGDIDAQPDQQSVKPLMITDRTAVYVPPSGKTAARLVFQRGTALFVQEFDEQRVELRGDPIPIADDVGSFAPARAGLFSVSPDVLAFQLDASSVPSRLTWLDASGTATSTVGDVAIYGDDARLSPDGRRVAVSLTDDTGNVDVWVVDAVTGTRSRVTSHPSAERLPVWSFDGKSIFYTSNRSGYDDLYQRTSDGSGGERLLVPSPERKFAGSVSPHGDFLIYTSEQAGLGDIWALPLKPVGKPIALLNSDAREVSGQLSPDGRWLAYVSFESGADEIYVRRFLTDGGRPRVSDSATLVARGPSPSPLWRNDTQILFVGRNPLRQMVVDVDGRTETFQVKGAPRSLFPFAPSMFPANTSSSAFTTSASTSGATDGTRFLYAMRQPVNQVPNSIVIANWRSTLPR